MSPFTFTCDLTRVNGWWRASRDGQWYDAPTPARAVAGLLNKLDGMAQTLPEMPVEYRGQAVRSTTPIISFSIEEITR